MRTAKVIPEHGERKHPTQTMVMPLNWPNDGMTYVGLLLLPSNINMGG